jgi:5-methyltetrahydrofolate--homocysteine methyltransferase
MKLEDLLQSNEPVIADGGMGTMLINLGLVQGNAPELWNVERPENIRQVQRGYIEAGAQIILTNSFGGSRLRLERHGCADRAGELNRAAALLSRKEAAAADHPVVVAGSMGPLGEFFEPMGSLTLEAATEIFAQQASALASGGVDIFWIETMSDLNEVEAAVAGCRRADPRLPVVATMTFDTKGRTMMGITPEEAAKALAELGVLALGANCGNGPREIETVIAKIHGKNPEAILVAKANAGLPHLEQGRAVYDVTPNDMAEYARRVWENGARIVGACCGSTPAHIRAISHALKETA